MKNRINALLSRFFLAAVVTSSQALSCDLFTAVPFTVISSTPGSGRIRIADGIPVSVLFSEEPDRASAENSFSLTEDGEALPGFFSWSGSSLTFHPCGGLRTNREYRLSVSADARNASGVSLDEPFEVAFSSKPEYVRPVVIETSPCDNGFLEIPYESLRITFSEAVDMVSFNDCSSISPSIKGNWKQDPDDHTVAFTPLEPWIRGAGYDATISADLLDLAGNRMGEPFDFHCTVGMDAEPPVLLSVHALDESGTPVTEICADEPQDGMVTENSGWEASWKLRFHFSEPVSWRTFGARIESSGGVSLEAEWNGEYAGTIDCLVSGHPAWGDCFTIRVLPGVEDEAGNGSLVESRFNFIFDGLGSRPPRFAGIRLPLAPGEILPGDRKLVSFSIEQPYATIAIASDAAGYPIGVPVATSFEVYFELAAGAALNLLSLRGSFRFSSTNNSLEFSADRILDDGFEYADKCELWADLAVARIYGTITNHVDSGILTLQFASGLCDSSGNINNAAQRLPLLK